MIVVLLCVSLFVTKTDLYVIELIALEGFLPNLYICPTGSFYTKIIWILQTRIARLALIKTVLIIFGALGPG